MCTLDISQDDAVACACAGNGDGISPCLHRPCCHIERGDADIVVQLYDRGRCRLIDGEYVKSGGSRYGRAAAACQRDSACAGRKCTRIAPITVDGMGKAACAEGSACRDGKISVGGNGSCRGFGIPIGYCKMVVGAAVDVLGATAVEIDGIGDGTGNIQSAGGDGVNSGDTKDGIGGQLKRGAVEGDIE